MINIIKKELCNGCYACINICPKSCISMERDSEGFLYPKVEKNNCIDCNLCENICSVTNSIKIKSNKHIAYACKNRDDQIRTKSSSGGVFSLLCEEVINNNGIVFGAAFDKNFNVKHMYSDILIGCEKFRGSKYVQSEIGSTYSKAKEFLDEGKQVLFSGTQCQIKGLNLFLLKRYDNLLTTEIVCHGVPSPKIFNLHKENLVKKFNSDIVDIKFRNKEFGWRKFSYSTKFKNDSKYSSILTEDIYMIGFLNNIYLRPSCYNCKAKAFTSDADISLADYWGIETIHPDLDDDKGVSLVIVNNSKGEKVFEQISGKMKVVQTDFKIASKYNKQITQPVEWNYNRRKFFKLIKKNSLQESVCKCLEYKLFKKIEIKVSLELNKVKKRFG